MTLPLLNELLISAGAEPLGDDVLGRFGAYLALLMRWNARTNLTAIRDEAGIVKRHFLESILAARALPLGEGELLDFGSGAGFPGLPIAIYSPRIVVTLAESQNKKAAFLREAVRTLGVTAAVHSGRAETLAPEFDCVAMRAVDHMEAALPSAVKLVKPNGWIVVMTTEREVPSLKQVADKAARDVVWRPSTSLIESSGQVLLIGRC